MSAKTAIVIQYTTRLVGASRRRSGAAAADIYLVIDGNGFAAPRVTRGAAQPNNGGNGDPRKPIANTRQLSLGLRVPRTEVGGGEGGVAIGVPATPQNTKKTKIKFTPCKRKLLTISKVSGNIRYKMRMTLLTERTLKVYAPASLPEHELDRLAVVYDDILETTNFDSLLKSLVAFGDTINVVVKAK